MKMILSIALTLLVGAGNVLAQTPTTPTPVPDPMFSPGALPGMQNIVYCTSLQAQIDALIAQMIAVQQTIEEFESDPNHSPTTLVFYNMNMMALQAQLILLQGNSAAMCGTNLFVLNPGECVQQLEEIEELHRQWIMWNSGINQETQALRDFEERTPRPWNQATQEAYQAIEARLANATAKRAEVRALIDAFNWNSLCGPKPTVGPI